MSRSPVARYFNPWKFRREEREVCVQALRARDGDNCTRCRRPIRFDLPPGHDQGPTIETSVPVPNGAEAGLHAKYLCHGRCNRVGDDHTAEVLERIRRHNEAELLPRSRQTQRAVPG